MKHGTSSLEAYAIVISLVCLWLRLSQRFGVRLSRCSAGWLGRCPIRPHPVVSGSISDCQTGSGPMSEPRSVPLC